MDGNRQKYVELSLAGKWIKLAREIIIDNPGIDKSKFMEIAVPLMPTHIGKRGRKLGQVELVNYALSKLIVSSKCVELIDGKLISKKVSICPKGYVKEIVDFAINNGTVSKKDLPHITWFGTLVSQLRKRNVLRKVKTGVYAIVEVQNDG